MYATRVTNDDSQQPDGSSTKRQQANAKECGCVVWSLRGKPGHSTRTPVQHTLLRLQGAGVSSTPAPAQEGSGQPKGASERATQEGAAHVQYACTAQAQRTATLMWHGLCHNRCVHGCNTSAGTTHTQCVRKTTRMGCVWQRVGGHQGRCSGAWHAHTHVKQSTQHASCPQRRDSNTGVPSTSEQQAAAQEPPPQRG
jgi:hypothetical protein